MRRVVILFVVFAFALMGAGGSAAYADLMVNGGAEDGVLTPWTADSNYSVETSENRFTPQAGSYFFHYLDDGNDNWLKQTGTNGLTAGPTLELNGWCATDGYDYGEAKLSFFDASDTLLSTVSTTDPLRGGDREWVPFSLDLDVPAGAALWEVNLVAHYHGSTGYWVDVNWDSVSLNAVPIPGAVWLLGSGLIGLVAVRRRKDKE